MDVSKTEDEARAKAAKTAIANHYEDIGKNFAEGVLTTLGKWTIIVYAIITLAGLSIPMLGATADDTDFRASNGAIMHSGLKLRVDYGTSCEYLETVDGALVPRRDAGGNQICPGADALNHKSRWFWRWEKRPPTNTQSNHLRPMRSPV